MTTRCETAPTPTGAASPTPAKGGTAALAGALAMTMVGSSAAVNASLADAPVLTTQALRYAVACALLLGFAKARAIRVARPTLRELGWLAAVAATGLVLFNIALVRGGAHAEPAVFAVAIACVPVVLALGESMQSRQPTSRRMMLAAALVSAGAVLVAGFGRADAIGIALAVAVLACEAGFTLLAVPVLDRLGAWGVSVHTTWIATLIFGVGGVITEGPTATLRLSTADLLAAGYLALGVTAIAFVLWYGCVARIGAGRAGLLTAVAPVAAVISGVVLGGNPPPAAVWLGIGVIGVGLAMGLRNQ